MAPAKVGRKKRAPPPSVTTAAKTAVSSGAGRSAANATQSDAIGTASNGAQATILPAMSVDTAAAYYGHLHNDIEKVSFRLGGALWLHQIVAVVVVNTLMYDLHVQTYQVLLVVWAALWLGRGFITEQSVKKATRVNVQNRIAISRVVVLAIFIGAALALHYHVWKLIPHHAAILLTLTFVVDVLSINRVRSSFGSAHASALGDIGEMVFVILIFSTQYNQLSHIIYDRIAIAFVVVTQVVHSAVVHGVKYALFSMPWTNEHQAKRNQRFRRDAINVVARTVYLSDDGKPATPGKRKKGMKLSSSIGTSNPLVNDQAAASAFGLEKTSVSAFGSLDLVTHCLALQTLIVTVQIFATAFVLHSWELCSIVMCTSIHLLLEVLLLHSSLARPHPLHTSAGVASVQIS